MGRFSRRSFTRRVTLIKTKKPAHILSGEGTGRFLLCLTHIFTEKCRIYIIKINILLYATITPDITIFIYFGQIK